MCAAVRLVRNPTLLISCRKFVQRVVRCSVAVSLSWLLLPLVFDRVSDAVRIANFISDGRVSAQHWNHLDCKHHYKYGVNDANANMLLFCICAFSPLVISLCTRLLWLDEPNFPSLDLLHPTILLYNTSRIMHAKHY
jgi:hypothetical protein